MFLLERSPLIFSSSRASTTYASRFGLASRRLAKFWGGGDARISSLVNPLQVSDIDKPKRSRHGHNKHGESNGSLPAFLVPHHDCQYAISWLFLSVKTHNKEPPKRARQEPGSKKKRRSSMPPQHPQLMCEPQDLADSGCSRLEIFLHTELQCTRTQTYRSESQAKSNGAVPSGIYEMK